MYHFKILLPNFFGSALAPRVRQRIRDAQTYNGKGLRRKEFEQRFGGHVSRGSRGNSDSPTIETAEFIQVLKGTTEPRKPSHESPCKWQNRSDRRNSNRLPGEEQFSMS